MPGHLFIVQADLTRLEVDALAIPTDPALKVEGSWLASGKGRYLDENETLRRGR